MANTTRIMELDELRLVEERLLREREECERLEAQIRLLASGGLPQPTAAAPAPSGHSQAPPPAPPMTSGQTTQAPTLSSPPPPNGPGPGVLTSPMTLPMQFRSKDMAPTASPKGVLKQTVQPAPLSPDRFGLSTSRSVTSRGGTKASSPSAKAGVVYRSPIYRSSSPSRSVGRDKVVTTSFGRAPRFRDEKDWVPGPGKYHSGVSEFSPITVNRGVDEEGALGHTWAAYAAAVGDKPTPAEQHELAMLAATARFKPSDTMISPKGSDVQEEDVLAKAAAAMLADAGGDVKLALESAIRRERMLRREIQTLHKHLSSQKVTAAAVGGQLRNEAESTAADLARVSASFDALSARVSVVENDFHSVDDAYTNLQDAINELGTALASAVTEKDAAGAAPLQRVLAKFPSLSTVVERAKALDRHLQNLSTTIDSTKAVAVKMRKAGTQATTPSKPSRTPSPQGRANYSSLTNVLSKKHEVGTLGDSGEFMDSQTRSSPGHDLANGLARTGAIPAGAAKGSGSKAPAADVLAFATKTRRRSQADAAVAALQAVAASATVKGYDVEKATQAAWETVVATQAKVSPTGPPRTPLDSTSSKSSPNRRASLSAAVSAARGRVAVPTSHDVRSPTKITGVSPTAPVLRRMSVGVSQIPTGTISPAPAKETTVSDTLQQIFKYYSVFGDRDSDGQSLKSQQFYKLVRDSGLLNPETRITPADVDVAFTRSISKANQSPSKAGPVSKMRFEGFIGALNEMAVRAYRGSDLPLDTADPEAFRQLVQEYLLPLYPKVKSEALFILDVAQVGAEETAAAFAQQFTQPEVLNFFNEHRSALQVRIMPRLTLTCSGFKPSPAIIMQAIFSNYALSDRRMADRQSDSTFSSSPTAARMSKKALVQFATDYKVIPEMMSRPDLLAVSREAARAIGHDSAEEISYPEWIELLAMIAFVLGDSKVSAQRANLVAVSGFSTAKGEEAVDTKHMPLLTKLAFLFYNMYENGAKFSGMDTGKLVRASTDIVRTELEASNRAAAKAASVTKSEGVQRVQGILSENIIM